jgi:hypothetical protein
MLAFYIKCIFDDNELACRLSKREIVVASKRHDRQINKVEILKIYERFLAWK